MFSADHQLTRLRDLQDRLRTHIRARINRAELTGTELSREAGFQQGHLSNFLNSRRGLSLKSMDRLFNALGIDVLDLVDAEDVRQRIAVPRSANDTESVVMVSDENSLLAHFTPDNILGAHSFKKSFLRRLKANDVEGRGDWQRFVLIRLDSKRSRGMFPVELSGATLLVDRHYNSLQPLRRHPNIYMVRFQEQCAVGYLSALDDHLVLRSCDPHDSFMFLRRKRGKSCSQCIVGRVCHIGIEV